MEKKEETKSPAIYAALNAIMNDIGSIGKERQNQQQHFMFRGIDQVMNTLKPLLAKHHVNIIPEVVDMRREERRTGSGGTLMYSILTIKHHFVATDGSEVVSTTIGEGMDSGDKASNKAMSIAYKYACFQVFCIPTEEMTKEDPDLNTPDDSVSNDYFALFDKIGQCITIEQLNALYKVDVSRYKNDPAVIQAFATRKQQLQTT
jgi:hypothetical protein